MLPKRDLQNGAEILARASRRAIQAFLGKRSQDDLVAIGFVFEFGGGSPSFELCANTREGQRLAVEQYGAARAASDDLRWNSGGYNFPAGLLNQPRELGAKWDAIINRVSQLIDSGDDAVVRWACEWLTEIATQALIALAADSRLIGDWKRLDFNVASVDHDVKTIKRRHQLIRKKLKAMR